MISLSGIGLIFIYTILHFICYANSQLDIIILMLISINILSFTLLKTMADLGCSYTDGYKFLTQSESYFVFASYGHS